MTKTPTQRPEIFRGVQGNCEVRFTYTFADGEEGYVSGHVEAFAGHVADDGTRVVTGLKVRVSRSSRIPDGVTVGEDRVVRFDAGRIKADPETGLIVPISKKEMASGTGAARFLGPSDRQVAYALSLCNRDGDLGGGNFYRPSEAEFRGMSRSEISQWIDTAKFELGIS
jgi:hypothetical protein